MRNGAGAARLICVFTACILLLGYNFYGRFFSALEERRDLEEVPCAKPPLI